MRSGVQTAGAECVIVGRSNIVGKPMAALMVQQRGRRRDGHRLPQSHARSRGAHAARGHPDRRRGPRRDGHRRHGEAGRGGDRRRHEPHRRCDDEERHAPRGDVDFARCGAVASQITPVPGGVGPMTIAMLLQNTVAPPRSRRVSGRRRRRSRRRLDCSPRWPEAPIRRSRRRSAESERDVFRARRRRRPSPFRRSRRRRATSSRARSCRSGCAAR